MQSLQLICYSCSQRFGYRIFQSHRPFVSSIRCYRATSSHQQTSQGVLQFTQFNLQRPFLQQSSASAAYFPDFTFSRQYSNIYQDYRCFKNTHHVLQTKIPSTIILQKRSESTNLDGSDLIYLPTPVEWSYELLEYFHDEVCLSWSLAIIATTLFYKGVFAFPFAVLQQRVFARVENAQPEINTYVEQMKQQLALTAKEKNWSKAEHERQFNKDIKIIVQSIHRKDRCSPVRLSYVALAQMSIWISVTMALGQMSGWYPDLFCAELDIDVLESLSTGGALWFTDLMQSDLVLPVMVGLTNLALVELWSLRRGPLTRMQDRFHNLARVVAVCSMPVATMMPSAISFYWMVSSLFGLGQFALLRIPWIRRGLGIPQAPSEMKQPFTEMLAALKIKYQGKKVF